MVSPFPLIFPVPVARHVLAELGTQAELAIGGDDGAGKRNGHRARRIYTNPTNAAKATIAVRSENTTHLPRRAFKSSHSNLAVK